MAFGLFGIGEQARGFDDNLYAQFGPGQLGRRLGDDLDLFAVDDQDVEIRPIRRRFLGGDRAVGLALNRVQTSTDRPGCPPERYRRQRRHRMLSPAIPAPQSTEHKTTDTTKTIDCDFCCHRITPYTFGFPA